MNRLVRLLSLGCMLALAVLLERSVLLQAAPSATPVCGTIGNSTWNVAGSPYQVCAAGVTVNAGATLNIEPGVTVEFTATARLTARGALFALGTPEQPITFTGAVATPGSWQGLIMESLVTTPTQAILDHVTIRYGGLNAYAGAQIYADRVALTVTNSLVRDGLGSGLYGASHAALSVHDTAFLNHGLDAVRLSQPLKAPDLGGLTAAGNGRNIVFVDGSTYLPGQQHWTAAGIPYLINAVFGNAQNGYSLSIAPGSELRFTSTGSLLIRGDLQAIGLPGAPITLTGDVPTPGYWTGLTIYGLTQPATAQLDYVTVEYGGKGISSGANILVDYGHLVARHSIVRHSLYDGVRFNSSGRGSIMSSQVVSNTQYGVRNMVTTRWVLASNNWWGDPAGPKADVAACGSGNGDRVTGGVVFNPALTSADAEPFPLTDAPLITLTPRRWFAPADSNTRLYFDITVRDGNGAPLAGRTVILSSSLGLVTSGGITDANGHTQAYVVSNSAGEAEVTASLAVTGCEGALSPASRVTFTPPLNITDLFPGSPAPYLGHGIDVAPLPVIVGVTTTMRVSLTNPLSVPITVDVQFGFTQASVGLAFGPIKEVTGQVIPANSTVELSASWVPLISGHYCVDVAYTITAVGAGGGSQVLGPGGSGRRQRNLNTYPGPTSRPNDKAILNKADNSWQAVSGFSPDNTDIQMRLLDEWWEWAKSAASEISQALGGDPPRQDYDTVTQPVWPVWTPAVPNANRSPARAAAMNAASAALADVLAYGQAAALALDRSAGASEASNLGWAAQQANAQLFYQAQMGAALLLYANALEDFVQVLVDEGETSVVISAGDVINYQQRLANTGFTAAEINMAHGLGWTDAQIEARRQALIAADPNSVAGNWLDKYTEEAAVSRELGLALLASQPFRPGLSVGGSPGLLAASATGGNSLAQIGNTVATFQVGNPLTQTAVIDLRARRLDLPADWMVSVYPGQVTLAPGTQTTVTVTVLTGSLAPQNTIPRVAVEGYAGSLLLGGVVVDIVVPKYLVPLGINDLFLPLLRR